MARAGTERFHELDGLRAVAILLVYSAHAFLAPVEELARRTGQPWLAGLSLGLCTSGVELFFVLSGIVLLRPYLRGERPFRAGVYFRRRVQRLWPPYLGAWLLSGGIIALYTLAPTWFTAQVLPPFSWSAWLAQLGMVNFGWTTYNGAWWSLTPELLFYGAVPGVVALAARPGCTRQVLGGVLAASVPLAVALKLGAAAAGDPLLVRLAFFLSYVPCFVAGTLLAKAEPPVAWAPALMVGGGLAGVAVSGWVPALDRQPFFGLFYLGLVSLALHPGSRLRKALSHPLLVWLGERSYSLFLTHLCGLYLANYVLSWALPTRGALVFVLSRILGTALALLFTLLLFHTAERPFARSLATAGAVWPWQALPRANGRTSRGDASG